MRTFTIRSTTILAALFVLLLHAIPAAATSSRTWVASNGTNNPTCGRMTPCATFQQAHDATTPGGVINCVDAGDYAPLNITKAITINCENTHGAILGPTFAIAIAINAGVNDIVTLKGLDLDGHGGGAQGIFFSTGAALHVHKVQIRNFGADSCSLACGGIIFAPFTFSELYVSDSHITDNGGVRGFNGGIMVIPNSTASANVSINRVRLENNSVGLIVDGSFSSGVAANVVVVDSVISGSASNVIQAATPVGNVAVSVFVDHSVISGNFGSGVSVNGVAASGAGSALVRLGDSTITLNVTGVSATDAGVLQSFKNNRISSNLNDGTPIPAFPGPGGSALQ